MQLESRTCAENKPNCRSYIVVSPPAFSPFTASTMVLLVTSDNEQFTTERDIVERSVLIRNMLEGPRLQTHPRLPLICFILLTDVGESDQPIPLPNVSSSVLKKVTKLVEDGNPDLQS